MCTTSCGDSQWRCFNSAPQTPWHTPLTLYSSLPRSSHWMWDLWYTHSVWPHAERDRHIKHSERAELQRWASCTQRTHMANRTVFTHKNKCQVPTKNKLVLFLITRNFAGRPGERRIMQPHAVAFISLPSFEYWRWRLEPVSYRLLCVNTGGVSSAGGSDAAGLPVNMFHNTTHLSAFDFSFIISSNRVFF